MYFSYIVGSRLYGSISYPALGINIHDPNSFKCGVCPVLFLFLETAVDALFSMLSFTSGLIPAWVSQTCQQIYGRRVKGGSGKRERHNNLWVLSAAYFGMLCNCLWSKALTNSPISLLWWLYLPPKREFQVCLWVVWSEQAQLCCPGTTQPTHPPIAPGLWAQLRISDAICQWPVLIEQEGSGITQESLKMKEHHHK